jgi:3-methyl-2-oxobutanoate hydroxymethyltransferase
MPTRKPLSEIMAKKSRGEKIVMLTAYDFPMAVLLDEAGVDLILVGDSLANVVLGLESTKQVGMEVMLHHAKAVCRGVTQALVVCDMPFDAYQVDTPNAVFNAKRFIFEAGCHSVKVEWFDRCVEVVEELRKAGISVMGHVGLTPQTAKDFKVQGKGAEAASRIMEQAKALETAGCFAIVLECVPEDLAREITASLAIPTIGIGAGKFCDGQVLVTHDMLGLNERRIPKFVKKYATIGQDIVAAVSRYREEVERGKFPGPEQTFH